MLTDILHQNRHTAQGTCELMWGVCVCMINGECRENLRSEQIKFSKA